MTNPLALLDRIEADIASLRAMLSAASECEPIPEAMLEPCVIAGRLGLSEGHVRRLCQRGQKLNMAGIERRGGRWAATVAAVEAIRDMRL